MKPNGIMAKPLRSPAVARTPPNNNNSKENHNGEGLGSPVDRRARNAREGLAGGMRVASPRVKMPRRALMESNIADEVPDSSTASAPAAVGATASYATPQEFSRQEVEELLAQKCKVKNRFDHKGRCEQMAEHIKRLKACIRWLQYREQSLVLEKDEIQREMENAIENHKEKEESFQKRERELELEITQTQDTCFSVKDALSKLEAEKKDVVNAMEKETIAREEAEKMQKSLSGELTKTQNELSSVNQQVITVNDINKRLQEYNASLQLYNSKLQNDASLNAENISKLQKEKSTIMETLSSLRGHTAAVQEQLAISKESQQDLANQKSRLTQEIEQLRTELQRVTDDRDTHAAQAHILTTEVAKYKECTGKTAEELERLSTKTNELEESKKSQTDLIKELRLKLEIANNKLEVAESAVSHVRLMDEDKQQRIEDLQRRLDEADQKISEGELIRRKLHNTILELKGNIRVFCRVRPLLPEEESSESPVVQYAASSENHGRGIDLMQGSFGQKYSFVFDKVFQPEAGQQEVFEEISQLIQSALDGYKVCIFAYGQTGSGKTHTMLGRSDVPDERGIIPRSLEQIFKTSQSLTKQGWKIKMQASMLEIYNETIRDLLVTTNKSSLESSSKQYTIKHDPNGNTIVSDLTVVDVTNWNEVSTLLHRASQSRAVGKTAMNEQSSRSHCVFTLRILGVNEGTEQQIQGVLNLIDLAGSERLSRSGATGDRLKETQAINKSLSCLGDVILAIANRDPHVPFRNSKLTYLLQPCLGGDSKTLMFVNISPDFKSFNESLCSLRFAAKVNACDIGVPRRHTQARISDAA